jgi:hypothetical protein
MWPILDPNRIFHRKNYLALHPFFGGRGGTTPGAQTFHIGLLRIGY